MLLKLTFIEFRIVEGGEARGQASKKPNEHKLASYAVDADTVPGFSAVLERSVDFPLHLTKRFSAGDEVGYHMGGDVDRCWQIARFQGRLLPAPQEHAASGQRLCPWHGHSSEQHKGPSSKSLRVVLLYRIEAEFVHQIAAKLAKLEGRLVIVEVESEDHGHQGIGVARGVAVPMLQADIHHPQDDELEHTRGDGPNRWYQFAQHVHSCAPGGRG